MPNLGIRKERCGYRNLRPHKSLSQRIDQSADTKAPLAQKTTSAPEICRPKFDQRLAGEVEAGMGPERAFRSLFNARWLIAQFVTRRLCPRRLLTFPHSSLLPPQPQEPGTIRSNGCRLILCK